MKKEEIIDILNSIAESLTERPNQFNIEISLIGTSVSNQGGVGIIATAQAPGSIGYQSTVDASSNVEIKIEKENNKIKEEILDCVSKIQLIISEISKDQPKKDVILSALDYMKNKIIPAVIISVVTKLVSNYLNI